MQSSHLDPLAELSPNLQATFVGHVVSVDVSGPTTRTIRIDDGTGKIVSTFMIDEDEEAEDPPRWRWLFHISRSSGFGETGPDILQGRCICKSSWDPPQIQGKCGI